MFRRYIHYIKRELQYYLPWIANKQVSTIYLGGGTPSLLPPNLFAELFGFLTHELSCDIESIPEVSLEVSPDTVDEDKLTAYRDVGINRVNLGIQTVTNKEIGLIGRQYCSTVSLEALETIQKVGFANVCVDLIYGLQGQTIGSWCESVNTVLRYGAETICAYPLTLRPFTGFAARGYKFVSGSEQYAKYDFVNVALQEAGYVQETHVRWSRTGQGGYIQKTNHWALQNILGIGAGARSYLWHCDVRNGYSVRHRTRAFREYLDRVEQFGHGRSDGFLLNDDELRRRAVILGLMDLNRKWFVDELGIDPLEAFPSEMEALLSSDLLVCNQQRIWLTKKGIRHRDMIAQKFFSSRVSKLVAQCLYDE